MDGRQVGGSPSSHVGGRRWCLCMVGLGMSRLRPVVIHPSIHAPSTHHPSIHPSIISLCLPAFPVTLPLRTGTTEVRYTYTSQAKEWTACQARLDKNKKKRGGVPPSVRARATSVWVFNSGVNAAWMERRAGAEEDTGHGTGLQTLILMLMPSAARHLSYDTCTPDVRPGSGSFEVDTCLGTYVLKARMRGGCGQQQTHPTAHLPSAPTNRNP